MQEQPQQQITVDYDLPNAINGRATGKTRLWYKFWLRLLCGITFKVVTIVNQPQPVNRDTIARAQKKRAAPRKK